MGWGRPAVGGVGLHVGWVVEGRGDRLDQAHFENAQRFETKPPDSLAGVEERLGDEGGAVQQSDAVTAPLVVDVVGFRPGDCTSIR